MLKLNIKSEYKRKGIIHEDGTIPISPTGFDYCIYPWIKGYNEMYNIYKADIDKQIELNAMHKSCGCLWFNWYKTKMLK